MADLLQMGPIKHIHPQHYALFFFVGGLLYVCIFELNRFRNHLYKLTLLSVAFSLRSLTHVLLPVRPVTPEACSHFLAQTRLFLRESKNMYSAYINLFHISSMYTLRGEKEIMLSKL